MRVVAGVICIDVLFSLGAYLARARPSRLTVSVWYDVGFFRTVCRTVTNG